MEFVGIDKFSLLDYEGYVSAVIFAPACNFRCPFCHNGESVLDSTQYIDFDEILQYLNDRKNVIDAVVVSGGEPTLMPDLVEKIRRIKELGFKVKLDTNGTNPLVVKSLIENKLIDYVAMDIKNSEEKYPITTGSKFVDINKIKETISVLINSGIDYEFRTTLVKELHSIDDMEGLAKLIMGAKKLYLQKFVDREGVIQKGLHHIDMEEALSYKDILSKYILSVELRGY